MITASKFHGDRKGVKNRKGRSVKLDWDINLNRTMAAGKLVLNSTSLLQTGTIILQITTELHHLS